MLGLRLLPHYVEKEQINGRNNRDVRTDTTSSGRKKDYGPGAYDVIGDSSGDSAVSLGRA